MNNSIIQFLWDLGLVNISLINSHPHLPRMLCHITIDPIRLVKQTVSMQIPDHHGFIIKEIN